MFKDIEEWRTPVKYILTGIIMFSDVLPVQLVLRF